MLFGIVFCASGGIEGFLGFFLKIMITPGSPGANGQTERAAAERER
jgi:hypothetical protein